MEECQKEHAEIMSKLDAHDATLEFHLAETHSLLMSRHEVIESDQKLASQIEALTVAVIGEKLPMIEGPGRNLPTGMKWKVDRNHGEIAQIKQSVQRLEAKAANGGFKAQLSKPATVSLYTAIIWIILKLLGIEIPTL